MQKKAGLFEACKGFIESQSAPLYCPGHKGGRTLPAEFKQSIAELDLNNLMETDTLHCPSGPIAEAERLLAEAYGVAGSFLLVGGSTSGNIASVMSVCKPGSKILVQRNAHKSAIAGIVLAGANPVWLTPRRDDIYGIYHGVDASQLEAKFLEHSDAVGALVLNPTYYGTVGDIRSLRNVCDRHGKLLLVDEAHGPHFHFHPELPLAAEDAGADLIVQSIHKILSGLSQAAALHRGTDRVPAETVRKVLQLIQTTSPSFPIMISIDLARKQMVEDGFAIWTRVLEMSAWLRREVENMGGVRVMGKEILQGEGSGIHDFDESKLVIDVAQTGRTGSELLSYLNQRGVKLELSGPTYGLAILTVGSEMEDVRQLAAALQQFASDSRAAFAKPPAAAKGDWYEQPAQVMLPRDSFLGAQQRVRLEESRGRVCAEIVTPYPPGIPMLMPGEEISPSTLTSLLALRESGVPISASDQTLHTICVSDV